MKSIVILSLLAGFALAQDLSLPTCGGENDCTCSECNLCGCSEAGSDLWSCTLMYCDDACSSWAMNKTTSGGTPSCQCFCADHDATPEPTAEPTAKTTLKPMCENNECTCDECNQCMCAGGMWACTRKACPTMTEVVYDGYKETRRTCHWYTNRTYDLSGTAHCECPCVYPPSAASGFTASLLLVWMVLCRMVL